ncbi:MAG: DUF6261 family protein [Bacteroidales bacterium]|jgi:hypothetical protein|nr:DUF6261 family protein [Bacteroidales bacterium]
MKIIRLNFNYLRNEEWFQLFTEFVALVNKYDAQELDIEELFIPFMVQYEHADEAMELIRKSAETERMHEADRKRDATFRGMTGVVKSFLNHFDEGRRNAAVELSILIDHYGNLSAKAPDEETAGLYNLLQELTGNYLSQVQVLNLEDWVGELTNDNNVYEELVRTRNTEITSKTPYRMVVVRREAEAVYREIVQRIEAMMVVQPESILEEFITELNGFLKQRKDIDAQRQGMRKGKDTE